MGRSLCPADGVFREAYAWAEAPPDRAPVLPMTEASTKTSTIVAPTGASDKALLRKKNPRGRRPSRCCRALTLRVSFGEKHAAYTDVDGPRGIG